MNTLRDVSVPPIGWVIMPVGLILVLVAPRWLYLLMIFSIPFSATAVVNFGTSGTGLDPNAFGIQAPIFLGSLWLGRELLARIRAREFSVPSSIRGTTLFLLAFLTVAALSLCMPVIINGHFVVRTSDASHSFKPLTLSLHDVTQLLYLGYGITLAVILATRLVDESHILSTVRAYVAGGLAIAIWGWMEFVVLISGHSYPHDILNTNVHPGTQGYQELLHLSVGTVHRLSSATVEPSIFAQTLLTIIALLAVLVLRERALFSRALDLAALIVMGSIILLSAATTAYVGTALLLTVLFVFVSRPASRSRYAAGIASMLAAASVLYVAVSWVRAVIDDTVFGKARTWSAAERFGSVKDAWWHFVEYPVLGTGWGTAPSHDLIVFLLANVGVVGFLVFLALMAHLFWQLRVEEGMASDADVAFAMAARTALLTLLLLNVLTGFAFVFGQIWLVIALAAASAANLRAARESAAEPFDVTQQPQRHPMEDIEARSRSHFRPRSGWFR